MKIGIVNDSVFAAETLRRIVEAEPSFSIAWIAVNGLDAVEKCRELRPDLILMDMIMPTMDGVEATRRIMRETPCPILIVTGSVEANVGAVFEAMGAGALDVIATPPMDSLEARKLLIDKIRSIASITNQHILPRDVSPEKLTPRAISNACVMIGASAGGPIALVEVLKGLPANFPASVVIIQHIDAQFSGEFVSWLSNQSSLPVRLAVEGEEPIPGQVLIAEGGRHLAFARNHLLHYTTQPKLAYQPSVDIFFESALRYGPTRLMGVLLTGMGRDGARGLKELRLAGMLTIAQDEKTSAIYGMPRAAAEIGAAAEILPLQKVAPRIIEWSSMLN